MTDRPIYTLLLEGDPEEAALVRRTLEKSSAPYLLTVADRIDRGRRLLKATEFDVVLLGETGNDVVDLVVEVRELVPDTPLIVLADRIDDAVRQRALAMGVQDYLVMEREGGLLNRSIQFAIERNRSGLGLREREERLALALRGAKDGLWDWDLVGQHAYFSPRWLEIVGYEPEELASEPGSWFDRVHPDDLPRLQADLEWHFKGLTTHLENEHRVRHADGSYRWVACRGVAVRDPSGRNRRIAGSLTDVSERKAHEEKLQWDALHDALTGLPNRALLMDRLGMAIARGQRVEDAPFAVLYMDLDGFKQVNDTHGHLVGDGLLREVAERLPNVVRPGDTVARIGGDEFAILAQDLSSPGRAEHLAERILECFSRPFVVGELELEVRTSIGIAMSEPRYERPEQILRDADMALYRAKMDGKGRSSFFGEGAGGGTGFLELESDLRRAIAEDELDLHYQPIVSLESDRVVGFEALVRWDHPTRGRLYPDDFVPLAEETGLVIPLGDWVLDRACEQLASWQAEARTPTDLTMSVNISPKQFRQSNFVDRVWGIISSSGAQAGSVRLDITESILARDPTDALQKLGELKALGVGVHVDDFGTGSFPLGSLHGLPDPTIKIAPTLVTDLESTGPSSDVVAALVTLARALGMRVSVEGLETEAQVSAVRDLECDFGQGHFFSRAVGPEDAWGLLFENLRLRN